MDKFKGLSSATLKNIAIITMLIDHMAHVFYRPFILPILGKDFGYPLYLAMRIIGRIAFIIFAYQVGQAIVYTKSRKRYLIALAAFSIISEIPFNLALRGKLLEVTHQNVFITLFLGALCLTLMDRFKSKKWVSVLIAFAGIALAEALRTDYGGAGVLLIILLYIFRDNMYFGGMYVFGIFVAAMMFSNAAWGVINHPDEVFMTALINGALETTLELFGIIGIMLLVFYNGQKGKVLNKWFYYAFYPCHLLILYGIVKLISLLKG